MRISRLALTTPLLLGLASCAGDAARIVPASAVATSTRDAGEAARLITAYRRARGLGPVAVDDGLSRAALAQARAVAETGSLSHGAFASRMAAFGIAGHSAENLTAGSDNVGAAIGRWKNSPGHDANLLLPGARRVGLARADTPGHGYGRYWALVIAE